MNHTPCGKARVFPVKSLLFTEREMGQAGSFLGIHCASGLAVTCPPHLELKYRRGTYSMNIFDSWLKVTTHNSDLLSPKFPWQRMAVRSVLKDALMVETKRLEFTVQKL